MEANKMKFPYFYSFFFVEAKMQARQRNSVYGLVIATVNYAQFCICRFWSDIFYSKDTPQAGMPDVDDVDKITEIIELD